MLSRLNAGGQAHNLAGKLYNAECEIYRVVLISCRILADSVFVHSRYASCRPSCPA